MIALLLLYFVSSIACQALNFNHYPAKKWPNRQVPYVISNDFTFNERSVIRSSIDKWNRRLCIQLKPRNNEADYIDIISANGCWSNIGKVGGKQAMSLQHDGCLTQPAIWHQLMHSIGFDHEHNRPDRDEYIGIFWNSIPDAYRSQYQKESYLDFAIMGQYDYYSIMHYPIDPPGSTGVAFGIKDSTVDINRVGHAEDFSKDDLQRIRKVYCR